MADAARPEAIAIGPSELQQAYLLAVDNEDQTSEATHGVVARPEAIGSSAQVLAVVRRCVNHALDPILAEKIDQIDLIYLLNVENLLKQEQF